MASTTTTTEDDRIPELVVADSRFLGYAIEIDLDLSNNSASSNDDDDGSGSSSSSSAGISTSNGNNNNNNNETTTTTTTTTSKTTNKNKTIIINARTATKSTLSNTIRASATTFQCTLKTIHPNAAHVPIFWRVVSSSNSYSSNTTAEDSSHSFVVGYDEDDEPAGSVGPHVMDKVMMKLIDPSKIDDKNRKSIDRHQWTWYVGFLLFFSSVVLLSLSLLSLLVAMWIWTGFCKLSTFGFVARRTV